MGFSPLNFFEAEHGEREFSYAVFLNPQRTGLKTRHYNPLRQAAAIDFWETNGARLRAGMRVYATGLSPDLLLAATLARSRTGLTIAAYRPAGTREALPGAMVVPELQERDAGLRPAFSLKVGNESPAFQELMETHRFGVQHLYRVGSLNRGAACCAPTTKIGGASTSVAPEEKSTV